MLEAATELHRAGNLAEARRRYTDVLAAEPAHSLALFRYGLLELQDRHPEAALALLSRAAAAAPDNTRYQFGLGQALQMLGRWDDATQAYRRVLAAEPESADAHFALGVALQSQSQHQPAIAAFERAVQLRKGFADALNNLGMSCQLSGRLTAAFDAYGAALELRPDDATCLGNMGTLLREMGDIDRSIELLRKALSLEPARASHSINLAIALCQRRDFTAAEPLLRDTLTREPQNAEAAFNLGIVLRRLGQASAALDQYRLAVKIRPAYADAWNNLGNLYKALGRFSSAIDAFDAAIRARPNDVVAFNNLGCLLRTLGRTDDAEDALRRGLEIDARHAALHDNLGNVLKDAGELDQAIECYRRALGLEPRNAATHGNLAYALSFQSLEAAPIRAECVRWSERFAAPLLPSSTMRLPGPERRLRIGYASADFRDHCQSLFTIPLLAHHDHAAYEIVLYSSVERPDEHTRRIERFADKWRDVRALDDAELCAAIKEDQIDILVDLTMHMSNNRLLVFARKPAPVQISWLAYPGTTGMNAIDYRLSDPRMDPDSFDDHYTERTLRLPDSFWCYDPLTDDPPPVGPLPAMARGHVTLGCLNNPCKMTDSTLRIWGAVMQALPTAELLLLAPQGRHRRHLVQRLASHGIADNRVKFVGFRPRAEYLKSYHDIDLGLDTFPYNGHTTSLDALWMGVPTLTRVGNTSVGRGGLSQLFQLDLLEFAAETNEAFVRSAIALAADLPRLAQLRRELRTRLESSALMNGARFARNMEAIYTQAWAAGATAVNPGAR